MLRYRNLTIEYGAVIVGRFVINGRGSIFISKNCRLINTSLNVEGVCRIGANSFLNGTSIVSKKSVIIGDNCLISDAYITDTDFHNIEPELRHFPPSEKTIRPVLIGCNVWIGDRGVVLKGSEIGDDSVVGSNSVVRGFVPKRVVCVGNPAQVIKRL
jgi:acetyltransferase-like isoleucine patch superfamily enzyme